MPSDLSKYTKESVKALQNILDAVVYDLDITKQDEVNGYAKAIEDAIEGLVKKPADVTDTSDSSLVMTYSYLAMMSLLAFISLKKKKALR